MDEEGGGTRGGEEWSKTQNHNELVYTITSPCYYLWMKREEVRMRGVE